MIETTIISYLNGVMGSVPVGFEAPLNKPEKYVVLTMLDGGEINHIKTATINVDCYAKSLLQAAELCELMDTHLMGMLTLDSISSVSIYGRKSRTNTTTKTYCYECVCNLYYY